MAKSKDRRATDDLNVALSGISSALTIMENVESVEQMKKLAAMADEHVSAAWTAYRAIREAADRI